MPNHFSVEACSFSRSLNLDELSFGIDAQVKFRRERGCRYLDMKSLLMSDWDCADQIDEHHTVSSLEEVDQLMTRWVTANPDQLWIGYKTPSGGAHAFLVSKKITVEEGCAILQLIKCDGLYIAACQRRQCFAARIAPKPNRPIGVIDFIASFWKTWGTGNPDPDQIETMRLHDSFLKPLDRYYKL
jgi:hypothetical protein